MPHALVLTHGVRSLLPTGVGLPGCAVAQVIADLLTGARELFFAGTLAWHQPSDAVSILLLFPVMKPSKCSLCESSLFSSLVLLAQLSAEDEPVRSALTQREWSRVQLSVVVLQNKRNLMGTRPFHKVLASPSCFDSGTARHLLRYTHERLDNFVCKYSDTSRSVLVFLIRTAYSSLNA